MLTCWAAAASQKVSISSVSSLSSSSASARATAPLTPSSTLPSSIPTSVSKPVPTSRPTSSTLTLTSSAAVGRGNTSAIFKGNTTNGVSTKPEETVLVGLGPQGAGALALCGMGVAAGRVEVQAKTQLLAWLEKTTDVLVPQSVRTSIRGWCVGSSAAVISAEDQAKLALLISSSVRVAAAGGIVVGHDRIIAKNAGVRAPSVLNPSAQASLSAFLSRTTTDKLGADITAGLRAAALGGAASALSVESRSALSAFLSQSSSTWDKNVITLVKEWLSNAVEGISIPSGESPESIRVSISLRAVVSSRVSPSGQLRPVAQSLLSSFLSTPAATELNPAVRASLQSGVQGDRASSLSEHAATQLGRFLAAPDSPLDATLKGTVIYWLYKRTSFSGTRSVRLDTTSKLAVTTFLAGPKRDGVSPTIVGALVAAAAGADVTSLSEESVTELSGLLSKSANTELDTHTQTSLIGWLTSSGSGSSPVVGSVSASASPISPSRASPSHTSHGHNSHGHVSHSRVPSSRVPSSRVPSSRVPSSRVPSSRVPSSRVPSSRVSPSPSASSPVASPSTTPRVSPGSYWLADITHQGVAAFNANQSGYQVFRNVKDYGAKGDGVTDDTTAINRAISDGGRFGPAGRRTSTTTPAIVYFPAGTYIVSAPIIDFYFTQLIGNPNALPTIKASASFTAPWVIDGDQYQSDGKQGWISTNIFLRQIRNLVLDLTAIPASVEASGIHWPTGQATSIQNVRILLSSDLGTQHQGIFIEDGSGGFITDVTITGGKYGANLGNQQFTIRNLSISNSQVGIWQQWNWGWTYQGVNIANCTTAVAMTNGGMGNQLVGSIAIIDSTIRDCSVFVDTVWRESAWSNGSLILENVNLNNVPIAVNGSSGAVLAGSTTSITVEAWGQGHRYTPSGPANFQGPLTPATRPSSLLAPGSSRYYTRAKPQYESYPVASFVSIRSTGAMGDGTTDDTAAIQAALRSAASSKKIVFFDQGVYRVTDTIYLPPGSRIVGEAFPVIMGSGSKFSNKDQPIPVVQVGRAGESGSVEWSDMMVSTKGSTPGAVLVEWNMEATLGSGMWDVHARIGGFDGSELQVAQCPTSAAPSAQCEAAHTTVHVTSSAANVYLENVWIWTADHDLDDPTDTRISIYTGRGLLVEGRNIWLYGTSVEHHSLYQYHFSGAQNVVAGFIQTETPYWQPNPDAASSPFPSNSTLNDPDFNNCQPGSCNALGLRIHESRDVAIYGAGLYSFFNNYSTKCSEATSSEKCQSEIFRVDGSVPGLVVYALNTIGTTNMVVQDGKVLARYGDNMASIESVIAYLSTEAQ
ncbi:hypothetical protein EYZ11_011128 [Aspergillus tanneri]|uniref:Rhamnogalacturonase A/B/Epimerase-like pectate lyase domain-containing protein n=1 Tax=Aspergillus tanneri TaxID=1220188 RepID=A0A4S3J5S3_9EURO|nr:hypothetical protein EYZ11_011128 [Aspergillus tanneri]